MYNYAYLVREIGTPWYDSEIRQNSRKRDRLKMKAEKTGNLTDLVKYKILRNKVNNKEHAKELYYGNLELIITDFVNNNKRKFSKVIRHFVKKMIYLLPSFLFRLLFHRVKHNDIILILKS